MVRGLQAAEGGYDAAMLLVSEWNDPPSRGAAAGWNPAVRILRPDDPRVSPGDTGADVFFRKLLEKLFHVVPVQFHVDARMLGGYVPPGGVPDEEAGTVE
jgi:hypothetical protein